MLSKAKKTKQNNPNAQTIPIPESYMVRFFYSQAKRINVQQEEKNIKK